MLESELYVYSTCIRVHVYIERPCLSPPLSHIVPCGCTCGRCAFRVACDARKFDAVVDAVEGVEFTPGQRCVVAPLERRLWCRSRDAHGGALLVLHVGALGVPRRPLLRAVGVSDEGVGYRGGERLETVHGFDLVIDGSGADSMWFLSLFSQDARDLLELGLRGPLTGDALQESIGHDLAVCGVEPKLFLPGLAGLTQGPGFPNLSCLGLMSDRVLGSRYPDAAPDPSIRSTRRTDEHQPVR